MILPVTLDHYKVIQINDGEGLDKNPEINTKSSLAYIENSQHTLIGQTIAPQVAQVLLDKIDFDGTGRVLKFKENVTFDEMHTLQRNTILPLKDTQVRADGRKIFTPGECLINIACLVKSQSRTDRNELMEKIKNLYFSGVTKETLANFFEDTLQKKLKIDPAIAEKTEAIMHSLEDKLYETKHYENYYGRFFETSLVKEIIFNPTVEMQESVQIIREKILTDFADYGRITQKELCISIAKQMKDDPATWGSSIPETTLFVTNPNADTFRAMLNSKAILSDLLIMLITIKYLKSAYNFNDLLEKSYAPYINIIMPQRRNEDYESDNNISSRTGIRLPWQMKKQEKAPASAYMGIRPIDEKRLYVEIPTRHDYYALHYDKPVGTGMSGCANLFSRLFLRLKHDNPLFNMQHAQLYAACYLVHSGGHSINEAWTVFNYYRFKPTPYDRLIPGDAHIANALDVAWEKLLKKAQKLNS